jgi:hypothetical protein
MRVCVAVAIATLVPGFVAAEEAPNKLSLGREYKTVASALEGLRAKDGVKTSIQAGWTIIEDQSTFSVWSFTPSGHPAYPAVIRRTVVKRGDQISLQTNVLCEAAKAACDAMVAEFARLNEKVRERVNR